MTDAFISVGDVGTVIELTVRQGDRAGTALDLTGCTATVRFERVADAGKYPAVAQSFERVASIVAPATAGSVRYVLDGAEPLIAGSWRARAVITRATPTGRWASTWLSFRVIA